MVSAFFAASRAGDYQALFALLDPDVVLRLDPSLLSPGAPSEVRGAAMVARRAHLGAARGAPAQVILIDGNVGIAVAPNGRLGMVMLFGIERGKIDAIEIVRDVVRLQRLPIALLQG